jgi:hypothetical protein
MITTPEQNNIVRKKNNKAQNWGNRGRGATNGFQIFGTNGHISISSNRRRTSNSRQEEEEDDKQ